MRSLLALFVLAMLLAVVVLRTDGLPELPSAVAAVFLLWDRRYRPGPTNSKHPLTKVAAVTPSEAAKSEPSVRMEPDGLHWWFGDRRRRSTDDGVVIHPDDLAPCRATDLQRALRRAVDSGDFAGQVLVTEADEAYMNEDGAPVAPVSFALEDGRLAIELVHMSDEYEDEGPSPKLARLVEPVLKRRRLDVLTWSPDPYWTSPPWLWRATLVGSTRGRSLDDLFSAGMDVVRLLEAAASGNLTRTSVTDIVRGGHASALIGQPEGHWLDVKSQHYLSGPAGRISLAQSVTRFANAEDGGIVVVGMSTKRIPGGEEIRGVAPLPLDRQMARRYQQAIDERVFPPLDGLAIERVDADGGMLILIDIPPQPEELKPFLVQGAIVDGRVEGTFISIVRRRGEASIPITAPMIHASLAAGRALLRGKQRS